MMIHFNKKRSLAKNAFNIKYVKHERIRLVAPGVGCIMLSSQQNWIISVFIVDINI